MLAVFKSFPEQRSLPRPFSNHCRQPYHRHKLIVKDTKIIMGMPITVEITDDSKESDLTKIFQYFRRVDRRYSPYKKTSELSQVNAGLPRSKWSDEFKEIISLCEQTKAETGGFFDIEHDGKIDPSGLVKGWAIDQASKKLLATGFSNFYIEAGGDIQVHGNFKAKSGWSVGIRNPFNINEIVKIVRLSDVGIATSGTYIRGEHVYNPLQQFHKVQSVKSLTVIGPNIYEADRFATAAFAMGEAGINFIEKLHGFEAYQIDSNKVATFTSGFEDYVTAVA